MKKKKKMSASFIRILSFGDFSFLNETKHRLPPHSWFLFYEYKVRELYGNCPSSH